MRTTFATLGLAAVIGFMSQSASAVPVEATAINSAAIAAASVQQAHFSAHRTRHGIRKCYHEFIVGPYVCHTFYRWGW